MDVDTYLSFAISGTNDGQTLAHLATEIWDQPFVIYLLTNDHDFNAKDNNGETPYDIARHKGFSDICDVLWEYRTSKEDAVVVEGGIEIISESKQPSNTEQIEITDNDSYQRYYDYDYDYNTTTNIPSQANSSNKYDKISQTVSSNANDKIADDEDKEAVSADDLLSDEPNTNTNNDSKNAENPEYFRMKLNEEKMNNSGATDHMMMQKTPSTT